MGESFLIEVKRVCAEDVIDIRHAVLRIGYPRETAYFDKDNHADTFHVGGFLGGRHLGVATFQKEGYHGTEGYRLRGMGVLSEARSMGVGAEMLKFGEKTLKELGVNFCWCHARIGAINFYEQNGWERVGGIFEVPDVGPHYIMFKHL